MTLVFCLAKTFLCSRGGEKDLESHVSLSDELLGKEAIRSPTGGAVVSSGCCVVCLVMGHHLLDCPSLEVADRVPVLVRWGPSLHL